MADFVAVPIDSAHVTFDNLRLGRSSQHVVCRLLRFWDSRNINRDNQFMGITLLFLDEKNSLIHGFVPSAMATQFRAMLREGLIYNITSFDVGRCPKMYKITESPFVIRFMDYTNIAPVEPSVSIERMKFNLRNLDHLQALGNTNLELPDVVGQIRFLQGSNLKDPTSQQRLVVRFRVHKDVTVCLSLWDDAAATFRSHMCAENQMYSVMIVTTVNPKIFGGNLFLNSTPATRFFFDPTLQGIQKFKERMGINGETEFGRVDTTKMVAKVETVTIKELETYISKPAEEVQDAEFICVATVERVLKSNGWSYIACGACSTKVTRSGTGIRCNKCVSSAITGIVRYRVEFQVKDNSGKTIFVVFDSPMTKLMSKTAATLTAESMDDGDVDLPHGLQALTGKTYIFNIRVSPFNFTPKHRTFTVTTMTETNPLEAPNEIQATPPVPPADVHHQDPEAVVRPTSNGTTGEPAIASVQNGEGSGSVEDLGGSSRKRQKN